jgi:PAS domain S-box-containing protein
MLQTTRSAVICLAPDRRILSWNHGAERVFGYVADEVIGRDYFELFLAPELRAVIAGEFQRLLAGGDSRDFENAVVVRDGSQRIMLWNSSLLLNDDGETVGVAAIGQDVTELKRAQVLQSGESRALRLLVGGAPLSEVLRELALTIESVCPGLQCLFMLSDADEVRLHSTSAPSLPADYVRAVDGILISEETACCGVCAKTGRRSVTSDISSAAEWGSYRQPALFHGLRSSWSEPIISGAGRILGTFTAYSSSTRQPVSTDLEAVERAAHLASLAIEHERAADERLRESQGRLQDAVEELESLRDELRKRFSFEDIVAVSPAMLRIMRMAAQVAPTEATILVTGETGTGKEVLARAIHANSPRRNGPFLAVNCGAIPETLLESELFGHEKGAFTSADRRKVGQVERAGGGTLFLDEVGELIPTTQVKLLRMLQERTYERLGGTETLQADVRIIAATNRDLVAEMERGNFRDDLYYRLNVFNIHIPPLRERKEAIPVLAQRILSQVADQLGRPEIALSKLALQSLQEYSWKGNVRELQNALERAAILSDGSLIGPEHLPISPQAAVTGAGRRGEDQIVVLLEEGFSLERLENEVTARAMKLSRGNKSKAARLLGISRGSLRWRLGKMSASKSNNG